VIARARPELAVQVSRHAVDPFAFPSGHATIVFALATVLGEAADDHAVQTYLYGLAVLVAVSRVYLGVHYVTDVVAGAFIGTAGAIIVLQRRERVLQPFERYM